MIVWVLISSAIVIGFHFVLKQFSQGKGDLATSLHLIRRLQHLLTGLLILALFSYSPISLSRIMVTVPSVLFLFFDFARRKFFPKLNQMFLAHFEWLLRPHEHYDSPPAALSFLCGIAFATWLTDSKAIVALSILYLSVCDPAASIFGILIGGYKLTTNKSLAGTLAAGICGFFLTEIVFYCYAVPLSSFFGFFIALIAELLNIAHLDDNFTIPVISCVLWKILFSIASL